MKKSLTIAALIVAAALPAAAQDWSFGVSAGPFVFGDFLERRLRPVNEDGPERPHTITLSAATRPGLAVDVERSLADRWAIRAEGSFTRSPLAVRQRGGSDGVELEAGDMDVATFMVPLVFRINPKGTFRFHILGGPALAAYRLEGRENVAGIQAAFEGTQLEWGVAFGGGVSWWLSDKFALEGNITDTITTSPIDEDRLPDVPGNEVMNPHNAHGTVGLRWRF